MTLTAAHETALAAAFAQHVPSLSPLTPRETDAAAVAGDGLIFSFVGATSADVAVVIIDDNALTDGIVDSPLNFRLHEAITAAVGTLGAGSLSDTRTGSVSFLFEDDQARTFDLTTEEGTTIGHLAVRITRRANTASGAADVRRIANVEMGLSVEVGRTVMPVRKALGLRSGDIVELDRAAGAPADIKLNGRTIAHGEIVVQNNDYAVRVTRILDADA